MTIVSCFLGPSMIRMISEKKKKNVSTARYSYHSNSLPVWPSRSKLDLNLPRILRRILNLASKCTRPVHACLPARRVGTRAFARAPNSPVSKTKLASGISNECMHAAPRPRVSGTRSAAIRRVAVSQNTAQLRVRSRDLSGCCCLPPQLQPEPPAVDCRSEWPTAMRACSSHKSGKGRPTSRTTTAL